MWKSNGFQNIEILYKMYCTLLNKTDLTKPTTKMTPNQQLFMVFQTFVYFLYWHHCTSALDLWFFSPTTLIFSLLYSHSLTHSLTLPTTSVKTWKKFKQDSILRNLGSAQCIFLAAGFNFSFTENVDCWNVWRFDLFLCKQIWKCLFLSNCNYLQFNI